MKKVKEKIYDLVALLAHVTQVASFATVPDNQRTFYIGLSNIIRQPEFIADAGRASQVIEVFEKNDRFFLVFAIPSMICYMVGGLGGPFWVLFIGVGISLYGLTYFLIHDVYIHRRFPWFKQLDSKYSRAILRAYGTHHAKRTKEEGESFGLLVVSPKCFKKRAKKEEEQVIGNNVR